MNKPCLLVFAAGRGTRMRPLSEHVPKAMLPLLDVPLIDLALGTGAPIDWAERFVNVSGPHPDLRRHLQEHHPDVQIFDEGDGPIGQAATLGVLLPRLTQTVVTYNCDLVSDLDLSALLEQHAAGAKSATLAVQAVGSGADLVQDAAGLRLVDRRRDNVPGFVFLGAACFDRGLIDVGADCPPGLTEGLLQPAIERGEVLLVEHPGYARDVGTLRRYLQAGLDALDPLRLRIDTPGIIDAQGWYLGPGATTAGSPGKGAILLAGSHLSERAEVADCIVWPGCTVPPGVSVSDGIWFGDRFLPC